MAWKRKYSKTTKDVLILYPLREKIRFEVRTFDRIDARWNAITNAVSSDSFPFKYLHGTLRWNIDSMYFLFVPQDFIVNDVAQRKWI